MEILSEIYETYIKDLTFARVKSFWVLGMIILPLIATVDYLANPVHSALYVLRFGIGLLLAFALFASFKYEPFVRKNIFRLGYFSSLLPAVMIASYFLSHEKGLKSIDSGFYLILMAFCLMMPWNLKRSLGTYVSIYLVILGAEVSGLKGDIPMIFFQDQLLMVSAVLIASVASYFHEQLRFKEFRAKFDLNQSRKEMESAKNEIEKAYRDLKEADQIKTDFFTNVNHEIRTPLTLILLPLEMALNQEYGKLSPELHKNMSTVRTNALRLLNLINGLLDLAKSDAGKMELYRKKQDLKLIVQGIISSLSLIADKKNIKLSFLTRTRIPEFYFDREKVERTLINLISNALKFTDSDGIIEVNMEVKGEFLEVSVKDTGIGIPHGAFEKIFKRFVQVDSSSSRKYQGTGLGLTLCKEFVELHGGRIGVESHLGEGSTFRFTLPLMEELPGREDAVEKRFREVQTKSRRRSEDLTKSLSLSALYESLDLTCPEEIIEVRSHESRFKYQILIVEEHAQMREYIRLMLQKEYRVLTAQDGIEGLEQIKKHLPDLVISDLMMPHKDGYQLCQEIRANEETRHIPVILLTAKSEISFKMKAIEQGVTDYLSKPFYAEELQARVRSLFRLVELEKENIQSKKMGALFLLISGILHDLSAQGSTPESVLSGMSRIEEAISQFKTFREQSVSGIQSLPNPKI
ncbi:MAG: hybrid sensor histidine kinase/response regulator [Nitrospirae bacterium]|nr:hybrid sensor histidine kinase/response regulator [Nitrospirota bacterium]MBI3595270.1 hybrid sensor histidine kinase/response regulator [Nitrospirota bacterium]